MTALVIIARLIHVTTAIFWGGAILFINMLLGPSVMAVGPDGAKVMQELVRRNYFGKIIIVATLTILSGLYLMWVDSAGFQSEWFGTGMGKGISTGMLAALIAYIIGAFFVKPTLRTMLELGAQMANAPADQRGVIQAKMGEVQMKLVKLGMIGMTFLLIAMVAMAVARYL